VALFASCAAYDVNWKSYRTSEVADEQREIFGRVHVRLDGIPLVDCRVCFSPRNWYERGCARLDESGLVHMAAPRHYVWLKDLKCRSDLGREVAHAFAFPYYAADVRAANVANYIGDVKIDLSAGGGVLVAVDDELKSFFAEWDRRGKPPLQLKARRSLLKLQDDVWIEEQKTGR
jgi:hypothetical protein